MIKVAVIGGGINGCALVYELAKRGVEVELLERAYLASGASGRCGGGIRQQFTTKDNVRLAMAAVRIFEKLQYELNWDIEFVQGGYLVLAHSEQEMEEFKRNIRLQRSLGLKVRLLLGESEINEIVPVLDVKGASAIGAAYCGTDGHANPFKTTLEYARHAQGLGASIKKFTEVKGIKKKGKRFRIHTTSGIIESEFVVNAAGGYSRDIAAMLGIKLPNRSYRHEILATEALEPVVEPMIISFKDGIYFCQHPEGQIIGGVPLEETPGKNINSSLEFLRKMSSTLTRYIPALTQINVLRQWAGLYDVTPDARPILGYTPPVNNFINVCGFSGHGFMVAPAVAGHIAELIVTQKTPKLIAHLTLDRFKGKVKKEGGVVG